MIRVTLEVSIPDPRPISVMLTALNGVDLPDDAVLHRIEVEEADAP